MIGNTTRTWGLTILSKLFFRIPVLMLTVAITACAAIGFVGFLSGSDGLRKSAEAELNMVASSKLELLQSKTHTVTSDIISLSSSVADRITYLKNATLKLAAEKEQ